MDLLDLNSEAETVNTEVTEEDQMDLETSLVQAETDLQEERTDLHSLRTTCRTRWDLDRAAHRALERERSEIICPVTYREVQQLR